jgi:hypothetical protein
MEMYFKFIDAQSLLKKQKLKSFPLVEYLFWDAAIEKIDVQKNKRYIIERVLTRGFLEDFYTLLQIYSTEEIVETLKKQGVR